jgi:hypothetical protein
MSLFRRGLMMKSKGEAKLPDSLCFTALEEGTFTLTIGAKLSTTNFSYIEYSIDDGRTWAKTNNVASTEVVVTTPTIAEGGRVYWRGIGQRMNQANSGTTLANLSIFSSTCKFNISGLIMSLLVGKNATENTTISATYTFPRLFWQNTKVVDASGLILPKNTKDYCYDYLFLECSNLAYPPALPATSLSIRCYRQMFYNTALEEAPELPAKTMTQGCYYTMFCNCKKVRYLKMLATDISASECLYYWVRNMTDTSEFVFVKHIDATWTTTGNSGTLSNWTIIYYDPSTDKYYLSDKTTECDAHGNVINA